jgi:hypothetical protein
MMSCPSSLISFRYESDVLVLTFIVPFVEDYIISCCLGDVYYCNHHYVSNLGTR